MSSDKPRLSQADVDRLITDGSGEHRAELAAKMAADFADSLLSPQERMIAEEIFRALVKDIELQVRESLAVHLKTAPDLPRDLALTMARDVDSVALPVLQFSEVLTEHDLIEIVRQSSEMKKIAIAGRETVSSGLSDALIDAGTEKVVARLVSNEGATISEAAYNRVMSEYSESNAVGDSLARRTSLPPAISERLVSALTDRMTAVMTGNLDLPADKVVDLVLQARERATASIVGDSASMEELEQLVDQMYVSGRLTHSMVLRALCMGDVAFMELALARIAGVPVANARILIHDQGELGLASLCKKAGVPTELLPAFRAGVEVAHETQFDGGRNDRERHLSRTLQRILTYYEDYHQVAEDDLSYLMDKLQQIAA